MRQLHLKPRVVEQGHELVAAPNSARFQPLLSKTVFPQLQPVTLQRAPATGHISPAAPDCTPVPYWVALRGGKAKSTWEQMFALQTTSHFALHFLVGGEEKT